jgi:dihydrofolate synthase/folylpolyglutamate synthase
MNQDTIRAGLARAEWAGRLEVLQERDASSPFVVADGAHNGDSAEKLYHALRFHFEFERLYLIFGMLGDKETDAILKPFVGNVTYAWTVMTRHPRSANAPQVAAELREAGIPAMPAQGPGDALMRARERAKPDDLILFTGSLSLVAEAEELFGKA